MDRYRLDTGQIIDQEKGEILTLTQVRNRLNRQDRLIKIKEKHVNAMINALNEEIALAEDENLRNALIRIKSKELKL